MVACMFSQIGDKAPFAIAFGVLLLVMNLFIAFRKKKKKKPSEP